MAKRKVGGKIVREFLSKIDLIVPKLSKLFHLVYTRKIKEGHTDKNCEGTLFKADVKYTSVRPFRHI